MLSPRKEQLKVFKFVSYKDGTINQEFVLNRKKMLIGRFDGADIYVNDSKISHYHAFLIIDENGGRIIDLESDNGVFVNGERVKESFFSAGDSLRIGMLEFIVQEEMMESCEESATFIDEDKNIEKVDESLIQELPPELPPLPGLVVIDGEYCDIVFEEEHFKPHYEIPAVDHELDLKHYIDTEEKGDEIIPIIRESDDKSVEVTVMVNGNVLSVDYLPFKSKTYKISADTRSKDTILLPCLQTDEELPFIKIKKGSLEIFNIDGFESFNLTDRTSDPFKSKSSVQAREDDIFMFYFKTIQVIVKVVDAPPSLRPAPFFGREREFQKQAAKIFGAIMGVMLLLLFIDTTVEPPKKKLSIIYRRAVKAPNTSDNKSSQVADKKDLDTGIKKKEQDKKEPKFAKQSPQKTEKKPVKQEAPKKVAEAKAAPAPKAVKQAPKMKAYKLNLKSSVSSLFGSSQSMKTSVNSSSSTVSDSKSFKASTSSSDAALNSKSKVSIGTMGQDSYGNYDASSGSRGLASKKGIDTTYVDPKTVVLGSMDPELLRKILKEYLPQFRHCYQQELERNESVKGVVDLNFRINGNSSVSNINIKSKHSRFSKAGMDCMAGVLGLIPFPRPKGGGVVDVRQPLNFFSENSKY